MSFSAHDGWHKPSFAKGFEIGAEGPDEVLVGGGVVGVFAVFPDEGRAAFVENAGEEDKAAKACAHAPRRVLG
jgi:hypothetical protein